MCLFLGIPFDGKAGDTRLLSQNAPPDLLDDGLSWRLERESLICVLVVHIVADAHKLAVLIAAAEKNDSHANDLAIGDAREIWRTSTE